MKNARTGLILALLCACGGGGTTSDATATGTVGATDATVGSTGGATTTGAATTTTASGSATGTGDAATTTTTSGSTGEPLTTGATTAGTSDSSTGGSSTGSSSTGETPGSTSTGGTTGGGDALAISFGDILLYSNCQPIVSPDPIIGQWTVVFDNTAGAAEATADLLGAALILDPDGVPSEHPLMVAPTGSGPVPAGQIVMQEQQKSKGLPIPGCASCNKPYKLELVYLSAGVEVSAAHEATLDCVY